MSKLAGKVGVITGGSSGIGLATNVHFKGVFFLTQKLLPLMNDGGRIVNISTARTRIASPGGAVYASMKGAVEVLSRHMAQELGPRRSTCPETILLRQLANQFQENLWV